MYDSFKTSPFSKNHFMWSATRERIQGQRTQLEELGDKRKGESEHIRGVLIRL